MICKGCGAEVADDQLFCPKCGTKKEPIVNAVNTKRCVDCGNEYTEDRFFCGDCGGKLVAIASPQGFHQPWNSNHTAQPNQLPPNQLPPYQLPPNQLPPNQLPPNQLPPHVMPPMQSGVSANGSQKKNILPFIIIPALLIILIVGIFAVPKIINAVKDTGDSDSSYTNNDSEDKDFEDEDTKDDFDDIDETDTLEDSEEIDLADPNDDSLDNTEDTTYTGFLYGYTELPEVISLDSDYRFSYVDYYAADGIYNYQYVFDNSLTSDDFINALDAYSTLLQDYNGYYYEEEFSEEQYNETGDVTMYLTKDDYAIAISAEVTETYDVYVSIFYLGESTSSSSEEVYFPNYIDYVVGREAYYFELATEVRMENGVSFYLNSVIATDMGDGTMRMDVNVDLASYYEECYVVYEDFMVLPMDNTNSILADASAVSYILDNAAYEITTPMLLSTEEYQNLTLTYYVPATTTNFTFYGTNISTEGFAGPIYTIDMTLN